MKYYRFLELLEDGGQFGGEQLGASAAFLEQAAGNFVQGVVRDRGLGCCCHNGGLV